jgi:hypothetical protein
MKRLAILILLTVNSISSFSQDKIEYKAKGIYMQLQDANYNLVTEIPLGKDVLISYDTFFKKYSIVYYNENGELAFLSFSYLATTQDGFVRMTDHNGDGYTVFDNLKKDGDIIFLMDNPVKGLIGLVYIKNAWKSWD